MNSPLPLSRDGAKKRRQTGAAAIEFALVFVIFFMVFYGIVVYGMVFAIRHSMMQAANEGTRAAVQDVGGLSARIDLATATASEALAWMGDNAPTPVVDSAPCSSTPYTCFKVSLVYDYAANPIVPPLPALGIIVPDTLTVEATVQLNPIYF